MSFFSRDTRFSIFFLVSFALPAWAGCKAGTYCTWSACPNYSDCTACPGGQYYSTYRSVSSSCTECDEGYFCPIGELTIFMRLKLPTFIFTPDHLLTKSVIIFIGSRACSNFFSCRFIFNEFMPSRVLLSEW